MSSSASGRGKSIAIGARLREALASGGAKTVAELAAAAACEERTVRNYLRDAESTIGFAIEKTRGSDRTVRVRAAQADGSAVIEDLGRALARDMLRRLFPVAGTDLATRRVRPRAQLVVALRGAYEYSDAHLAALRAWLLAASRRPRRAVRLVYGRGDGRGDRIVWPIGIIVRDAARVYLAGMPESPVDSRDVRTYALERVDCERGAKTIEVLSGPDGGDPPDGLDTAVIEDAIDLPFSVYPGAAEDGVMVEARFSAKQADYLEGRRWHRKQSMRRRADGSLDLKFGPADRGEAEAWLRQWGKSVIESKCTPAAKARRRRG